MNKRPPLPMSLTQSKSKVASKSYHISIPKTQSKGPKRVMKLSSRSSNVFDEYKPDLQELMSVESVKIDVPCNTPVNGISKPSLKDLHEKQIRKSNLGKKKTKLRKMAPRNLSGNLIEYDEYILKTPRKDQNAINNIRNILYDTSKQIKKKKVVPHKSIVSKSLNIPRGKDPKILAKSKIKQVSSPLKYNIITLPISRTRTLTYTELEYFDNWKGPLEYTTSILDLILFIDYELFHRNNVTTDYKLLLYVLKFNLKSTKENYDEIIDFVYLWRGERFYRDLYNCLTNNNSNYFKNKVEIQNLGNVSLKNHQYLQYHTCYILSASKPEFVVLGCHPSEIKDAPPLPLLFYTELYYYSLYNTFSKDIRVISDYCTFYLLMSKQCIEYKHQELAKEYFFYSQYIYVTHQNIQVNTQLYDIITEFFAFTQSYIIEHLQFCYPELSKFDIEYNSLIIQPHPSQQLPKKLNNSRLSKSQNFIWTMIDGIKNLIFSKKDLTEEIPKLDRSNSFIINV